MSSKSRYKAAIERMKNRASLQNDVTVRDGCYASDMSKRKIDYKDLNKINGKMAADQLPKGQFIISNSVLALLD